MIQTVYCAPPTLGANKMFHDLGIENVSPKDADAIVFCGGEDLNPALYGEPPIPGTYWNDARDNREIELFNKYVGKKPMIGICRGAQFLCVMGGGKLWQDVDGHAGENHNVFDTVTGELVGFTNSVHHQMMRPADDAEIIAYAREATYRLSYDNVNHREAKEKPNGFDPEIVFWPHREWYAIQSHPEFGHRATTELFVRHLERFFK